MQDRLHLTYIFLPANYAAIFGGRANDSLAMLHVDVFLRNTVAFFTSDRSIMFTITSTYFFVLD